MARAASANLIAMSHPRNTPIGRFGIETFEGTGERVIAAIPVDGWINPLSGTVTAAPLAMLLDHVGGLANHFRKADDEWTVSTELSLELLPEAAALIAAHPEPVTACARPLGAKGPTALAVCEFVHRDDVIGSGSVRSFYIGGSEFTDFPSSPEHHQPKSGLADTMAVRPDESGAVVLHQLADPVLNNSLGVVHGGVAACGLELAGAAALNAGRGDAPLHTGSLRVNFMRRLLAGGQSRYTATALRVGRSTGIAEAQAIGADGQVALTARLTGYR